MVIDAMCLLLVRCSSESVCGFLASNHVLPLLYAKLWCLRSSSAHGSVLHQSIQGEMEAKEDAYWAL